MRAALIAEAIAAGETVEEPRLAARPAGEAVPVIDGVALWTGGREHRAPVLDR